MQKISDSTNTANPAGEFAEGNPAAGVPATLIKASWLNAIQRELVALVLGAGISLNASDDSQVLKAVKALAGVAADFNKLTNKPTTLGGYGITDAFTKPETAAAIQQAIAALVASSPAALDTLKELADALGNDPNFATTMTNALASKASKATTLGGYGITDAYTKTQVDTSLAGKANKATTVAGYGITDAYTKDEVTSSLAQCIKLGQSVTSGLNPKFGSGNSATISAITGSTGAFMVGNEGNNAASAVIAFHREGSFAAYFGLDTDNQWKVGGWSMGANAYVLWHAGNFNPATKLNGTNCANAGFTDSTAAQPFMTHSNGTTVGLARQDAALGVGQTWQDVKASRAANTIYTNTTPRPIQVAITSADANARSITVGGVVAAYTSTTYGGNYFLTATVPPGATYSYSGTFSNWAELRS